MMSWKSTVLVAAACAASSVAAARDSFLVAAPEQLPAAAQLEDAADMFLLKTATGRSYLYLESRAGERLYVLDVTNPARVADLGSVNIAARGAFRFGSLVGRRSVLMEYADGSHALLSFADRRHPAVSEPEGLAQASEFDVRNNALLVTVTAARQRPLHEVTADALGTLRVIDVHGDTPLPVALIGSVRRRLLNPETDTQFFLAEHGVTMVRDRDAEYHKARDVNRYDSGG